MPSFEFDPDKSAKNLEKHGIDFVAAQQLWRDERLATVPSAQTTGETRYLAYGRIGDKNYTAVFTYRGEKVRIISVRRSRREEVIIYDGR
ncbi:MAG: BrnT family toxin [Planctomycetota bacterium]|nr:BrnT family toxin [Planctomycetota bacterium]